MPVDQGQKIELRESKYWALLPLFSKYSICYVHTPWNKPINYFSRPMLF